MNLQAIAPDSHGDKLWRRPDNYLFAAWDAVVPLVASEAPTAQLTYALGFMVAERVTLVAVQGLRPGNNLFVAADGRWLGSYIPAVYREYPFHLVESQDGKLVFCVDEESDCIGNEKGEVFFDEEGKLSEALTARLSFLRKLDAERRVTEKIASFLNDVKLLQPWNITVKTETGEEALTGLFRIDENALNILDPVVFLQLRSMGALPMIYCQLLSTQNLQRLGPLYEAQTRHRQETLRGMKSPVGGADDMFKFNF